MRLRCINNVDVGLDFSKYITIGHIYKSVAIQKEMSTDFVRYAIVNNLNLKSSYPSTWFEEITDDEYRDIKIDDILTEY